MVAVAVGVVLAVVVVVVVVAVMVVVIVISLGLVIVVIGVTIVLVAAASCLAAAGGAQHCRVTVEFPQHGCSEVRYKGCEVDGLINALDYVCSGLSVPLLLVESFTCELLFVSTGAPAHNFTALLLYLCTSSLV